jgi:hypothetical protein
LRRRARIKAARDGFVKHSLANAQARIAGMALTAGAWSNHGIARRTNESFKQMFTT